MPFRETIEPNRGMPRRAFLMGFKRMTASIAWTKAVIVIMSSMSADDESEGDDLLGGYVQRNGLICKCHIAHSFLIHVEELGAC